MKASRHLINIAIALAAVLLAGCKVGPDYQRPAALGANPMPPAFGDPAVARAAQWKVATPAAHLSRGAWWEVFGDVELNRLEILAKNCNQQIAVALANLGQARAAVGTAKADFFPQVSSTPSVTRQSSSVNATSASQSSGKRTTYNKYTVPFDASWELDLWGRIRRAVEGARARFIASADDLESAKLTVHAEVAVDYFNLRSLDAQSELLVRTAEVYRRALQLTRNRLKSGVASDLDVSQAETQLTTAEAQIPGVDLQRATLRHALAVLCGQPATTFTLTPNTVSSTNLPAIPVSVPSDWLESRPDIAAAERRMAAANADVGVAKAAFFPRILLNGSGGYLSVSASALFTGPSQMWSLGPTLQMPLFTGGRNTAQLASARAAYEGAVATYRQTVLSAFQDVEDQLASQQLLTTQLKRERTALASARRSADISTNRYKAGVALYTEVFVSQAAALSLELTVVQLTGQRLAAGVSLIKALGAGWRQFAAPGANPAANHSALRTGSPNSPPTYHNNLFKSETIPLMLSEQDDLKPAKAGTVRRVLAR